MISTLGLQSDRQEPEHRREAKERPGPQDQVADERGSLLDVSCAPTPCHQALAETEGALHDELRDDDGHASSMIDGSRRGIAEIEKS